MHDEQEINVKSINLIPVVPAILFTILLYIFVYLLGTYSLWEHFHGFDADGDISFVEAFVFMLIPLSIFLLISLYLQRSIQFVRFRFNRNEMVFLSRIQRMIDRPFAYRIGFEDIVRIHLNERSLYKITHRLGRPRNFIVPKEFIQYPENEKAFLEALSALKRWHLDRGNTKILLELPEHYYSKKKDVWELRAKEGIVVFAVTGVRS